MTSGSPRVLILTASYGSGHNRVAEALAAEFRRAGAVPVVIDHFRDLVHPRFDRVSRRVYYTVLGRAPGVWGAAYWLGDQLSVTSPLLLGMNRLGAPKLASAIRSIRPAHVVTVHPTPAAALSEVRRRGVAIPPHTTVFTDFVAHTQWVLPGVDRYCVPAEEIANALVARGVARDRVTVTGIPVAVDLPTLRERTASRLALGLSARAPVLLFMAGSSGDLGRLEQGVRVVLGMPQPLQALVVAGHAGALVARLRALVRGNESRVKVLGYLEDVGQALAAADFLVTKAGGVTLAEALAADLPVICFGSLPGQEVRNERWATMAGVALLAPSQAQLHRVVAAALRDPALLGAMRERVRVYRRPEAARAVVDLVLGRRRAARERAS
jgi:processive 1,2-diacylglycerol beta-glucosyltransferase